MFEENLMRLSDIVALLIYLGLMACMGVYFSRKNTTTDDYFLGGRNFPGWALGLSMVGTSVSSVTFLAFPAAAFVLDWRMVVPNLTLPVVSIIAIVIFIPFFRHGKTASAFEYLEDRFGPIVRLYGAVGFIITQLIRIATVLYLMAIPINLLTGIDILWAIIITGIFVSFYTVAGGIDAVIWTDVIQTITLWVGGLLCLAIMIIKMPHGLGQIMDIAIEDHKFGIGEFKWDMGERTFYTMVLAGIVNWIGMYASDQNVVQRYIAAKSMKEARKATAICAIASVPTWAFFFFIGTAMFAFYKVFPDAQIAQLEPDQVFPIFILTQLPQFFAGLVIAGVLAAGMSSLDSSINAVSTISIVDILQRFSVKKYTEKQYLIFAQSIALITSVIMIIGAIVFERLPKESMMDMGMIAGGIFSGSKIGLYIAGFFTKRISNKASIIALVITTIFNLYLGLNTINALPENWQMRVHAYWIMTLVNAAFFFIAYLLSFIFKNEKQIEGLTVWNEKA
ncbi:MAG: sodium:solute symporter [Sedimentisphaeraceae bacterium JB056]